MTNAHYLAALLRSVVRARSRFNATARNGIRAGGAAVFGTISGAFVFMLATVAGLAAIMNASPAIFHALRSRYRPHIPSAPRSPASIADRQLGNHMPRRFRSPSTLAQLSFLPKAVLDADQLLRAAGTSIQHHQRA